MLVTPGPDLLYFAGYTPIAITERITMLVIPADRDPAMIVPVLERFGVRIEDIVAATEDGARRLNNASREMRIVA